MKAEMAPILAIAVNIIGGNQEHRKMKMAALYIITKFTLEVSCVVTKMKQGTEQR